MKIFKILICIGLMIYNIPSNAQNKDFLVLVTNDTIYGDENSVKRKKGKFHIKIDGDKRIYEFERVISYYNSSFRNRKYFEKVEILDHLASRSLEFAERINKHKGRVNTYIHMLCFDYDTYKDQACASKGYISKKGRTLKNLPLGNLHFVNKKAMKRLLPYLEDNPEIASEIENKTLTKLELGDLISKYNKSFDSQQ